MSKTTKTTKTTKKTTTTKKKAPPEPRKKALANVDATASPSRSRKNAPEKSVKPLKTATATADVVTSLEADRSDWVPDKTFPDIRIGRDPDGWYGVLFGGHGLKFEQIGYVAYEKEADRRRLVGSLRGFARKILAEKQEAADALAAKNKVIRERLRERTDLLKEARAELKKLKAEKAKVPAKKSPPKANDQAA